MKRQKISKKTSKKIFREGIPVKTINFEVPVLRGGIRM